MTEAEWLACEDPEEMWRHLKATQNAARTKAGKRKLRLWAVACCRCFLRLDVRAGRAAEILAVERGAVESCERFADGLIGPDGLEQAEARLRAAGEIRFDGLLASVCVPLLIATRRYYIGHPDGPFDTDAMRVRWLHEVFGNPFRRPAVPSARLAGSVREIALACNEGRAGPELHLDTARLAVLSDAKEEAGCTDADILPHLRSPGPHVRGCWALALVLGKE